MLSDSITFLAGSDWLYDIAGSTLSTPSDGNVISRFTCPRALKIPASFAGSQLTANVLPTTLATLTIKKNGTGLTNGTITINNAGAVVLGSVAETSYAAGDILEIEVTTADSIDEVGFSLKTVAG